MHSVSWANTHLDTTNLVSHMMVKNKSLVYLEKEHIFSTNKKILELCVRCHILTSYHFVAEATFN